MAVDSRTLVAQIADELRAAILSGHLKPGERVVQADFATRFGVSRTPLREALRILQKEGWLTAKPRVGYQVTNVSATELQEVAVMRLIYEPLAARIAADVHPAEDEDAIRALLEAHRDASEQGGGSPESMDEVGRLNRELHFALYGMGADWSIPAVRDGLERYWDRFTIYRRLYWSPTIRESASLPDHGDLVRHWCARDLDGIEYEVVRHVWTAVGVLVRHIHPEIAEPLPSLAAMAKRYGITGGWA